MLLRTISYSLVFLFLVMACTFAQDITCSRCLAPITGQYWKVQDNTYCSACYEKMKPKCWKCGANISGKYFTRGGRSYCSDCGRNEFGMHCGECNSLINGKYFVADGKNVCEECYYRRYAKRCAYCNCVLDSKYYSHSGLNYCVSCFESRIVPVCFVCGKKMRDHYLSVEGGDKYFCTECSKEYKPCKSCSVPVKKSFSSNPDVCLCKDCAKNIIDTSKELSELFTKVRIVTQEATGLYINFNLKRVYLVGKKQLYALAHGELHNKKDLQGLCRPEYIFGKLFRQSIYVQNGLPEEMVFDALSHEYAHAWLNSKVRKKYDEKTVEGFCEWVSYKNLVKEGYLNRAKTKKNNSDPIYGGGLRMMLKMEEDLGGASALVNYIRNKK